MNLPNKLTVLRVILTPVFMVTLLWNFEHHYAVALLIFIIASLTDMLDGKIARSRGLVTDFGKFLDPLADKMLTTAAFLGFIPLNIGAGVVWMAFIVLFREFAISSIRLIAVSSGGKVIAANIWGKLKTVLQMVAIIFALTAKEAEAVLGYFNLEPQLLSNLSLGLNIAITVLLWISTILCIISGAVYLGDNKAILKDTK